MVYLEELRLTEEKDEIAFITGQQRTCYQTYYPYKLFPEKGLSRLTFDTVTILCGGNGSGKSTLLNILACKLGLDRRSLYNSSAFFESYLENCRVFLRSGRYQVPEGSSMITSDDVFDYLQDVRQLNGGIDNKREELFDEYMEAKYAHTQLRSMADFDQLKKTLEARRHTQSRFVKDRLAENVRERSNGESAMRFFTEIIKENALYLLDEPENSLSAQLQQELATYIEASARCYGCQMIISTHSPFMLAIPHAKIYNLDDTPVSVCKWTEIDTVRRYYDFFRSHESEFE